MSKTLQRNKSLKNSRKSSLCCRKILNNWSWHVAVFVWRLYLNIIPVSFGPPVPRPEPAPVHWPQACPSHLGMCPHLKYYFCKKIHWDWDGRNEFYQLENFPGLFSFKQSCSQPLKINSLLWSRRDPLGIKLRKFEWKIWIICHKVETTKWLKIPRKSCLERGGWIFYFLIRFNIGNTRVWIALYIFHSNRRISLKHFKSWEQQQFTAPKLLLTTKTLVTIIKSGFSLTKIFVVYRESRSQ